MIGEIASSGRVELTTRSGMAALTCSLPSLTSMIAVPGVPEAASTGADTNSVSPSTVTSNGWDASSRLTLIFSFPGSSGSLIIAPKSTRLASSPAATVTSEGCTSGGWFAFGFGSTMIGSDNTALSPSGSSGPEPSVTSN